MSISTIQRERLGYLARIPPMALMRGTSPRVLGPIGVDHDILIWVLALALNQFGAPIRITIERSEDGITWTAGDDPLTAVVERTGDAAHIVLRRKDNDIPDGTRFLRAVISGEFQEVWHHASFEATVRYA